MKKLAVLFLSLSILTANASAGDVYTDMQKKMRFLSARQSVLSQNLANTDTPGYKANDIEPLQFDSGHRLQMATTSPMHVSSGGKSGGFKKIKQADTSETSPDGNNVSIEDQMLKISENDLENKETVGMLRQMNGLLRTAIGGNR